MRPYSLQIIAAMAGVAVASPVVEVAERGNANNIINRIECLIVDFVVDVLHECPTATPYCSVRSSLFAVTVAVCSFPVSIR